MGSTFDYLTGKEAKNSKAIPSPEEVDSKSVADAKTPGAALKAQAAGRVKPAQPTQPAQAAQPTQQQQPWLSPLEPTQPTHQEVAPAEPAQAAQPAEAPKPRTTYADIIRQIYPEMDAKKQAEEEAKVKRKKKRDATIAAVGDALTAMANIAATTRYANPVDVTSNNMSKKIKARYDEIKADRDKRKEAYRQMIARAQQLDAQQYENDVERYRQARVKADDDEWKRYMDVANYEQRERANENLANYRMAGLNQKSEQFKTRMEQDWRKAELAASTRRYAADHKSSGGGNQPKGYPLYNPHTHKYEHYANKSIWESKYAEYYPDTEPEKTRFTSTRTDSKGRVSTTTGTRERGVTPAQMGRAQAKAKAEYAKSQKANGAKQASKTKHSGGKWASNLKL